MACLASESGPLSWIVVVYFIKVCLGEPKPDCFLVKALVDDRLEKGLNSPLMSLRASLKSSVTRVVQSLSLKSPLLPEFET